MSAFVDQMEQAEKLVADWAADVVMKIYRVLSPEGRPYGYVEQTPEERLADYVVLRGDPEAWQQYILDSAQAIAQKLIDSGLDQQTMLSVHPWDIAAKYAAEYSIEMETELAKRAQREDSHATILANAG